MLWLPLWYAKRQVLQLLLSFNDSRELYYLAEDSSHCDGLGLCLDVCTYYVLSATAQSEGKAGYACIFWK